jgi:hypothetical protein
MEHENLVDIKEMAAILRVPVTWLYQRTHLGPQAIPFIKVGRYVRFEPQVVIDFLKNNGQKVGQC